MRETSQWVGLYAGLVRFCLALSVMATFVLVGCGGGGTIEEVDPALLTAEPRYARDIAPLFLDHCVACHNSEGLRDGGVELDRYETAFARRAQNVCVSVVPELLEQFINKPDGEFKRAVTPTPRDPPAPPELQAPCRDWDAYSMPVGAQSKLTVAEQIVLMRWVELGAPE